MMTEEKINSDSPKKLCLKCKEEKSVNEFHKNCRNKDGLEIYCKVCKSLRAKEYNARPDVMEKRKKRIKEYEAKPKNKKRRKDYIKEYLSNPENKEKTKRQTLEYRSKPEVKERIKRYQKDYNSKLENKEKTKKQHREYNSRFEVKERKSKQAKIRRETDLNFKLKCNLRRRVNRALENNSKSASTMELIGCSIEFLKEHLQNQFKEGMTWENYGIYGWHIDHIIPCTSFNLVDPEQQKKCFHYTNLQPLWAEENLRKGSKIL